MNYYSYWPILAILIGLLLFAATPVLKAADSPPSPTRNRVTTLDGLRGFLALSVLFHHGALYHTYIQDGSWIYPTDRLYALLGSFGVSMFFMITGFLFWSQLLDKKGRPDWVRLYVGRLFRIGPIYLVAFSLMLAAVFLSNGLRLQVSPGTLAVELLRWASLGLWSGVPINGYQHPGSFLANVTWSLRFEWFFYASLLLTAFMARTRRRALAFSIVGLMISLGTLAWLQFSGGSTNGVAFLALFFVGMLTGSLRFAVARVEFAKPVFSGLATVLILAVLCACRTAYGVLPICLLGGAFFLVANGTSLFGLLTCRASRRLGDVSFGIYLLQGLVLSAVFASEGARAYALASPNHHWLLIALTSVIVVVAATIAHVLIERPGVELGRFLLRQGSVDRRAVQAQSAGS